MKRRHSSAQISVFCLDVGRLDASDDTQYRQVWAKDPAAFVVQPLKFPVEAVVSRSTVDAPETVDNAAPDDLSLVRHVKLDTGYAKFQASVFFERLSGLTCLTLTPGPLVAQVVRLGTLRLPLLTYLSVAFCQVDPGEVAKAFPGLRFLDLSGNPASDRDLAGALALFTQLVGLDLVLSKAGDLTLNSLAHKSLGACHAGGGVSVLSLFDMALDADSAGLSPGSGLRALWLSGQQRFALLQPCSSLEFLSVSKAHLVEQDRLALMSIPSVSNLVFQDCSFFPQGLEASFVRKPLMVNVHGRREEEKDELQASQRSVSTVEIALTQDSVVWNSAPPSQESIPATQLPQTPE